MASASLGGVHCPVCHMVDTRVIDSRSAEDGAAIRRRRQCAGCNRRFNTFERVEEVALQVVKRSGGREPFDAEKLLKGLKSASKGRPVTGADFELIVGEIEDEARLAGAEVTTEWVGLAVLDRLRRIDDVAYLRFASVYKSFTDIADFEREARLIKLDAGEPAPQA